MYNIRDRVRCEYVLGLHHGHDSGAAIVKNGKIIAAAAEERFTQIKHFAGVPYRSLEFCLKQSGITMDNIDLVVFPSIGCFVQMEVLLNLKKTLFIKAFQEQKNWHDKIKVFLLSLLRKLQLQSAVGTPIYIDKFPFSKKEGVLQIEHHLAHASAAYYSSGFQEKTLVITADGSGDGLSTTVWIGADGKLTPRLKLGRNSSLGFFFGLVTESLGWWVGDGEGKTMGLAPFGSTDKSRGVLNEFLPIFDNGYLQKGYNWGPGELWEDTGVFHYHFQDCQKVQKLIKKYGRENISAEAQRCLEEQLFSLIIPWIEREKVKYFAAAGGVFLNVKANQKIWNTGLLEDFFIYPDAGDAGLAVGAALYGYFLKNQQDFKTVKQIDNVYWGPEYPLAEIEDILRIRKIKYQKLTETEMFGRLARLLVENKTIALFNGRMETGPRALGNRSILMSPLRAENKDIINVNIKYRESFRPFCPSIIDKAAREYLKDTPPNSAFMIFASDVPSDNIKNIPAVVHVDGTVRVQLVKRDVNKFYYDLINEFGKLTGVPLLLNTSFNIKGEPIVCSPWDAIKCFYNTGLEYLVFNGVILISK